VQSLAETRWRLNRIFALETAIFAQLPQDDQRAPTQLEIYLKYEKQLRNLHIQEGRLHRRYEKELAELLQLQKDRYLAEASLATNGFEFSNFSSALRATPSDPAQKRVRTRPQRSSFTSSARNSGYPSISH
jgi:hypothetical protein